MVPALWMAAAGPPVVQNPADLMRDAMPAGEVVALQNEYVRVRYTEFEYPKASVRIAESRPVLLYVRISADAGIVTTRLFDLPQQSRPSWRPGVTPRGVHIEALKPPPPPPRLGEPGTELPRDAGEEGRWEGGRLILATFRPSDYGVGLGGFPSVTVFLSDSMLEVSAGGLRRRMAVRAGEAFWFEARTRLTNIDDFPVSAAVVQFYPLR